jgi:hypothetical protein
MTEKPEIKLLQGFCELQFGASRDEAVAKFGDPEETQDLLDEELNNESLVYHYWNEGYSLFFDKHRDHTFWSVEIDNKETTLFGVKVFTLREKELITLMKDNGYQLSDSEVHQWGEKRVSFDKAGLDCYFENNRLVSINFGVVESNNTFLFFPN